MNILAIDTANATCSVTLRFRDGSYVTKRDETPSKQAEMLFSLIDYLFKETGTSYASLDKLAVSIGPGSFTGIRIGMSAARGIALATHLPLTGVTTLEATAWSALQAAESARPLPVVSVLDARRKQIFIQSFAPDLTPLCEAALSDYADIPAYLPPSPFILAGSGSALVSTWLGGRQYTLSQIINPVNSEAIAIVAALKPDTTSDMPSPFYIRKPDATPQKSKLILK